jgi:predicted dehydrogenase
VSDYRVEVDDGVNSSVKMYFLRCTLLLLHYIGTTDLCNFSAAKESMMLMSPNRTRREFLTSAAATLTGVTSCGVWSASQAAVTSSPNEKLNVACIGVMGKGAVDADGVIHENIVAICDVDQRSLAKSSEHIPKADKYTDYRELLLREDIDAVTISTPDHHHAIAAAQAIKSGKHVYCQKPLTHTVHEARVLRELASKHAVATQMGNQGHSDTPSRRSMETLRSGALGPVREAHIWTDRPIWPQGMARPEKGQPVPKHLNWDLWLGPAPERPYHPAYHPFKWRGFWDFGTGALGDMACHCMDIAFFGLELVAPTSIEAESSGANDETAPEWSIIKYEFPARGQRPAVKLTWYDGPKHPPADLVGGKEVSKNGLILIGDAATLYIPHYWGAGEIVKGQLAKKVEMWLPDSPGHYREWIAACKGGAPAMSNFDYSGPLTEMVLLGNVALRSGQRIEWDAENMSIPNSPEAEKYLTKDYRDGWTI